MDNEETIGAVGILDGIIQTPPVETHNSVMDSIPNTRTAVLSQGTPLREESGVMGFIGDFFNGFPTDQQKQWQLHEEAVSTYIAADAANIPLHQAAKERNSLKDVYEHPTFGEALTARKDFAINVSKGSFQRDQAAKALVRAFRAGSSEDMADAVAHDEAAFKPHEEGDPRIGTTEQWPIRSIADLAGQLYSIIDGAKDYAVVGAAGGAAIGATAGGVGAAPGGLAGATTMGSFGSLKEIFDSSHGHQMMAKMRMGMDANTAYYTSIPTAAIVAITERMAISAWVKHIPGVDKIYSKAAATATKKVEEWTMMVMGKEALKTGVYTSAIESGQTVVEQVDIELTKALTNEFQGTNISHRTAAQIIVEAKDAFVEVLPGSLFFGSVGPASSGIPSIVNRKLNENAAKKAEAAATQQREEAATPETETETETVVLDALGQQIDPSEALPDDGDTILNEDGEVVPSSEVTQEEIIAQEVGVVESPVTDQQIDDMVISDDVDLDGMLEDTIAEAEATGKRYGDFIGVVRRILPRKQARVIESLLRARAKATGRTKEQFAEDNKLAFRVEEDETGKLTGSVEFIQDGETIVRAFQNTNLRDVTHEIAHVFRKDMSETELSAVQEAFGVKDGKWGRAAEERFAEGFVEFLATGEAPTKGLKKVFSKFKTWLGGMIKSLQDGGVKISSEMIQAYGSLLKGDLDAAYTTRVDRARDATHKLFSKKGIKSPPPTKIQKAIRKETGQVRTRSGKTVDTHVALKESLRKQVTVARNAMIQGDKKGYDRAKAHFKAIAERARNKSAATKSRAKIRKSITKLVKAAAVKIQSGKVKGQFTAGFQDVADELIKIMLMPVKEAKRIAKENKFLPIPEDFTADIDILKFFLTETRANMGGMDEKRLSQLHANLKEFFETGRADRANEIGGRIAKVIEMKNVLKEGLRKIRERKFGDPDIANAYKEKAKDLEKLIRTIANYTVYDFHGLMELLDMGSEAAVGKGAASLFGETLRQENQSNTGRRLNTRMLMTKYAEIFNILDKAGNPDPIQAKTHMEAEGKKQKTDFGEFELLKKEQVYETDENGEKKPVYELDENGKRQRKTQLVSTERKHQVSLSKGEARKMWMEIQDPDLHQSYLDSGMPQEMIDAIMSTLTAEDKALAEAQFDLYEEYYSKVNEVFRKVQGTNLPYNERYSPVVRDYEHATENGAVSDLLMDMSTDIQYVGAGSKQIKSRKDSRKMLKPQDDIATMLHYIRQMEHYMAFAEKVQELNGVFRDAEVQQALRDTYGDGFLKTLGDAILNIARNGSQKNDMGKVGTLLRQMRGNLARGMVGLKPLATLKQLSSFVVYGDYMPIEALMSGVAEFMTNPAKHAAELKDASEFLQNRGDTLERDLVLQTNESEFKGILGKNIPSSFNEFAMKFVKAGDIGAIYAGGWAYYKHLLKQGMSKEDAIFEMERVSRNTQQSSELGSQTAAQQGGEVARMFTMFTTSQRQYTQQVAQMLEGLAAGRATKGQLAKTSAIFLVVLPALFRAISQGGVEDDEDLKSIAQAVLAAPFSGIPGINMGASYMMGSWVQGHTYGRGAGNIPAFSPLTSTVKGLGKTVDLLGAEDITYYDVLSAIRDSSAVFEYVGIPSRQIGNATMGVADVTEGKPLQGALEIMGMSPSGAEKRVSK